MDEKKIYIGEPSREIAASTDWRRGPFKRDEDGTYLPVQRPTREMVERMIAEKYPAYGPRNQLVRLAFKNWGELLLRFEQVVAEVVNGGDPLKVDSRDELGQIVSLYLHYEQEFFNVDRLIPPDLRFVPTAWSTSETSCEPAPKPRQPLSPVRDPFETTSATTQDLNCLERPGMPVAAKILQEILTVAGEDRQLTMDDYCVDLARGDRSTLRQVFKDYFGLEQVPNHDKVETVMGRLLEASDGAPLSPQRKLYIRALLDPGMDWLRLSQLKDVVEGGVGLVGYCPSKNIYERDLHKKIPEFHQVLYAAYSQDDQAIELFFLDYAQSIEEVGAMIPKVEPIYMRIPLSGDPEALLVIDSTGHALKDEGLWGRIPDLLNHATGIILERATAVWKTIRQRIVGQYASQPAEGVKDEDKKTGLAMVRALWEYRSQYDEPLPFLPGGNYWETIEGRDYRVDYHFYTQTSFLSRNEDPFDPTGRAQVYGFLDSVGNALHHSVGKILHASPILRWAVATHPMNIVVAKSDKDYYAITDRLRMGNGVSKHPAKSSIAQIIFYKGEDYVVIKERDLYEDGLEQILIHEFSHAADFQTKRFQGHIIEMATQLRSRASYGFGINPFVGWLLGANDEEKINQSITSDPTLGVVTLYRQLMESSGRPPSLYGKEDAHEFWAEALTAYIRKQGGFQLLFQDGWSTNGWDDLWASPEGRRLFISFVYLEKLIKREVLPKIDDPTLTPSEKDLLTLKLSDPFEPETLEKIDEFLVARQEKMDLDEIDRVTEHLWQDQGRLTRAYRRRDDND